MKKLLLLMSPLVFLMLFFLSCPLKASNLYYSDGSSIKITKAEGYSAVVQGIQRTVSLPGEVLRLNTGKKVFSVLQNDRGSFPVYFLGDMPVIADRMIFWRGDMPPEKIESKYDLKLVEILSTYPLYIFLMEDGDSVEVSEKIVQNGDGFAFPNLVREVVMKHVPDKEPKDPYFDVQWHLRNSGEVKDYYGNTVNTVENADIKFLDTLKLLNERSHKVDTTVKIAIMDTGVVPDHPDLTNIEPGYDALRDEEGGYPDLTGIDSLPWYMIGGMAHGTTCAGVSAAVGNDIGMSGVCPWCQLYPVRYLASSGGGTAMDEKRLLKTYERYIADPKISVINCSFGPPSDYGTVPITSAEVETHQSFMLNGRGGLGGVIVYAAGNDGIDSGYSRLHSHVFSFERDGVAVENRIVSVAASSAWDTRIVYSNYGKYVDIAAPSLSQNPMLGIATTTIPGYGDYHDDYTLLFSGTSAAAPVVSGMFGVIFSINPDLTLEEAIEIMRKSADKIHPQTGSWDKNGHSVKFGYGRVNLLKAARLAMGLPMCDSPTEEDICGNNTDDNCDGFVDTGCALELTAGMKCEDFSDCLSDGLVEADVECLEEIRFWRFKEGYCVRKTNKAPCPDGTRAFAMAEDGVNYLCAPECTEENPCKREGYYCRGDSIGVCVPYCARDSDCAQGAYCDVLGECSKIPSDLGGTCENDLHCKDDLWCIRNFKDGYCTSDCAMQDDSLCPDDGKCVVRRAYGGQNIHICLQSCSSDRHCRGLGDDYYVCHGRMTEKEGVCFRKCRDTPDCIDPDAICNEEGRCVPSDWEGWPGDEIVEEVNDEDEIDADMEEHDSDYDDADSTDDDEEKSKSKGCSLIYI